MWLKVLTCHVNTFKHICLQEPVTIIHIKKSVSEIFNRLHQGLEGCEVQAKERQGSEARHCRGAMKACTMSVRNGEGGVRMDV